jgi:hypothetical protein
MHLNPDCSLEESLTDNTDFDGGSYKKGRVKLRGRRCREKQVKFR